MFDTSFIEGKSWWGGVSPDRISFRAILDNFNPDALEAWKRNGYVNITTSGGKYRDININAEGLIPGFPLIQQIGLQFLNMACQGVFNQELSQSFAVMMSDWWDWADPVCIWAFIATLEHYGFLWVRHEVAYDFPTKKQPVTVLDPQNVYRFKTSLYSLDKKQTFRVVERNGTNVRESKGNTDSFVCAYSRGSKLKQGIKLYRLELRLLRHHLDRLSVWDLCLDFHSWLWYRHGALVKFLRKAVRPHSWSFNRSALRDDHFLLEDLLTDAEWEVLS